MNILNFQSKMVYLIFILSMLSAGYYLHGNIQRMVSGVEDIYRFINPAVEKGSKGYCYPSTRLKDGVFYGRKTGTQLTNINSIKNNNLPVKLKKSKTYYDSQKKRWIKVFIIDEVNDRTFFGKFHRINVHTGQSVILQKLAVYQKRRSLRSDSNGWVYYKHAFLPLSNGDLVFRNDVLSFEVNSEKKQPFIKDQRSIFGGRGAWPNVGDTVEALMFNSSRSVYKKVGQLDFYRTCRVAQSPQKLALVIFLEEEPIEITASLDPIEMVNVVELTSLEFDYVFSEDHKNSLLSTQQHLDRIRKLSLIESNKVSL